MFIVGLIGRLQVRFGPLWLAPWLLSSMLLDLFSTSLLEILEILIPNWSAFFMVTLNALFAKIFYMEEGSRLASFLAPLAIWCLAGLCYLPASVPGCVAFQRKVCNHKLMLEQMSNFDIRKAKCSVPSDRQVIEDQARRAKFAVQWTQGDSAVPAGNLR